MKLTLPDLYRIRWSIALSVFLALLGVAIATVTYRQAQQARQALRLAEAQNNEAGALLAKLRAEEKIVPQKLARYRELLAKGIIGEENRLDWIEQIRSIAAARKLSGVSYELSPRQRLDSAALAGGEDGYEFMSSRMSLRLNLLHEGELLDFFADLRRSLKAQVMVRECKVERLPRTDGGHGITAQLKAECAVDLITLREKDIQP